MVSADASCAVDVWNISRVVYVTALGAETTPTTFRGQRLTEGACTACEDTTEGTKVVLDIKGIRRLSNNKGVDQIRWNQPA